MRYRAPVLIGLAGAAATAAVAAGFGMSTAEAVRMTAVAGGAALGAGGVGTAVLLAVRRRSIAVQAAVVTLTALAAVTAGVLAASHTMFLATHDLHVVWVVLLIAGTVAVIATWFLGRRVLDAQRQLGRATRAIGQGEPPERLHPSTAEFAELGRDLEAMSRRLDEARERERVLEASRRELVAWVSHDLRTPLAGIRAMSEALEDGVVHEPEDVRRYYAGLRREADHLSGLVDDLFELSRIQAGALRLEMERVPLSDLVSEAIEAAHRQAATKGVTLEGRMRDAPKLRLSTPEFSRVLRNLLENAIRHTPADGSVWVEAGVEAGRAFVSVGDGCGGIPETDLDRVFDLAFRGQAQRTPGDGGAGLGLSIARGIVEAHRGEIEVQNAGTGCRFTVRLPLDEPAARPETARS